MEPSQKKSKLDRRKMRAVCSTLRAHEQNSMQREPKPVNEELLALGLQWQSEAESRLGNIADF